MTKIAQSALLPTYNRFDLSFTHGKGAYLYNKKEKYLDFASGIGTNSLGHCHPKIVRTLATQAKKLWHLSNLYQIPEAEQYAKKLIDNSFADFAFFANSGAEAVECAIKAVRKYHNLESNFTKNRIITFKGSFHGRTMAAISASGKEEYQKGFEPVLGGFDVAEFNDIEDVKKHLTTKTAGILIEPIQGEGGIRVAKKLFLKELRALADKNNIFLMFDEVQCGFGKTGTLFAHEFYGVKPDIMTLAKGIGTGFPIGACLMNKKAASAMLAGSHGTTYGSNPLATKVAGAVFDIVSQEKFLKKVKNNGEFLQEKLRKLKKEFPEIIVGLRGIGMMIGLRVNRRYQNLKIIAIIQKNGLLTAPASDNVIRILPPLIVNKSDIRKAVKIIKNSFNGICADDIFDFGN